MPLAQANVSVLNQSCVARHVLYSGVTAAMRQLLEALAAWPDVDTDDLRRRPEWAQARALGLGDGVG